MTKRGGNVDMGNMREIFNVQDWKTNIDHIKTTTFEHEK